MTETEFDTLIAKLEPQAQANPARYRFKVGLLAMLGNAYLGAVLTLLLALMIAMLASVAVLKFLALKLVLVLGALLWSVLRALKVDIPPPEGTVLSAAQTPALFASIDKLQRALDAPRFHEVLLTDDFNAAVVQRPRYGIFGGTRNYLLLGLPLMKTLTVPQFEAVLAHEFGHLSRNHARMSNWIYRQRLRWAQLRDLMAARKGWAAALFVPFLNRYAPYFSAYSYPLARASEFEADATSARLTSPAAAAQALTSVNVVGCYLSERYWPGIHKQADVLAQPQFSPYVDIGTRLTQELDEASVQSWLDRALARRTSSADTHPALAERLQAINAQPQLSIPAAGEAADQLLGNALHSLTEQFDQRWRDAIAPSWQARHAEVSEARETLAALDARVSAGETLEVNEALRRAQLHRTATDDRDGMLQQLRALYEREPEHVGVIYTLGCASLAADDDSGAALIEQAMARDEGLITHGTTELRDYYWRIGKEDEARSWHQRLVERSELEHAAEQERMNVTLKEKFDPHGLDSAQLASLREALRNIPHLRRAYLVRKRVRLLPHQARYVLGYSVTPWYRLHRAARADAAMQALQQMSFPAETTLICVDGVNYRFGRKFWWMRGVQVI